MNSESFEESAGVFVVGCIGLLGFIVVFSFLMAYPVMWLWNGCLVPAVNGIHQIGWLQAWGISVLASFLFKSSSNSNSK